MTSSDDSARAATAGSGQAAGDVRSGSTRRSMALMYTGFAAAGLGCALPGALLPAMLVAWRLQDRGAGLLFFTITFGSALGALTLARRLKHSVILGFTLVAIAAAGWGSTRALIGGFGFLWGLGLGMAMTGISLMYQRSGGEEAVHLVRLNLLWALGACLCPVLMTHALRASSPQSVFLAAATAFAALALAMTGIQPYARRAEPPASPRTRGAMRAGLGLGGVPASLILVTVLSTGIEASGGAWLATYAERSRDGVHGMVAAPTCLWAGLLASRVLGSIPGGERRLQQAFRGLLALVAVAALGLLIRSSAALLVSAFLLGFGLGPIYPSLLARVIRYRQTGSIFFLAGTASALMPWLTGAVSSRFASLRSGLSVLVAGALVLLVVGLRVFDPDDRDDAPKKSASLAQAG